MTTWDEVAETTAVTSNPAAGTISVDVKTFTGRGQVSYVTCSCVADANVATRQIQLLKVSGANTVLLGAGVSFAASATGTLNTGRGWTAALGVAYSSMLQADFAPGDTLRVLVALGQAGDDMSAITYSYKEML